MVNCFLNVWILAQVYPSVRIFAFSSPPIILQSKEHVKLNQSISKYAQYNMLCRRRSSVLVSDGGISEWIEFKICYLIQIANAMHLLEGGNVQ